MAHMFPHLILASGSPRRRELLTRAGYAFDVDPADVDESDVPPDLTPPEVASYLAVTKARAVAARHLNAVVLAADTVVALGRLMLGKPTDADDATRMLKLLSGTTQRVSTGVAVIANGNVYQSIVTSTVSMRALTNADVDAYVRKGQWDGKAGGYGIQDEDPFVTRTEGSMTNIVGLPMDETRALLASVGITPALDRTGGRII